MVSVPSYLEFLLKINMTRLLLISIGISGFLLQVLLTEGLQREKAGRATNMIVSTSARCLEHTSC